MNRERIEQLIVTYRDGLLEDTLPFWLRHAIDAEDGGYLIALDRDGSLLDTDKGMWQHCRFIWVLSTLAYQLPDHPSRDEWVSAAKHGVEFVRSHAFDADGRMFFHLTKEGRPLRKRRYLFTECFGTIALAAYARASGDDSARRDAWMLVRKIFRWLDTPGALQPKGILATRRTKSIGFPMIMLNVAQVLRETINEKEADKWIDNAIDEIRRDFMKPDLEAVMETVGPRGEILDHFDGRTLNPGHAIEAAWFILAEAEHRGCEPDLISMGCQILDWMWARGWDSEYGGVLYFRDLYDKPVQEYWHDMKFWWPHNETIIATLLAHHLTGDEKYAQWHELAHDWAYQHFPDPEHGEWYGYLHRDGRISVPLKGNMWKGPFHLPRMQWTCWRILQRMRPDDDASE